MEDFHPQIEFRNAGYVYRDGSTAVEACRNLDFSIQRGESVVLIGPSGCGKSTSLLLADGLLSPTEGSVSIDGQPAVPPRRQTAFIPQDLGLLPWKTVEQNAMLGLRLRGLAKAEASKRALRALSAVGLEGFEGAYPKELSGGMRQRLAFARALTMDADILLMDEPLSAIDALLRESLQDMLMDLWRERHHTQVLVTHSIEEAVYLGQRILIFCDRPGTIVDSIVNDAGDEPGWRDSARFAALCRDVRSALDDHGANSRRDCP